MIFILRAPVMDRQKPNHVYRFGKRGFSVRLPSHDDLKGLHDDERQPHYTQDVVIYRFKSEDQMKAVIGRAGSNATMIRNFKRMRNTFFCQRLNTASIYIKFRGSSEQRLLACFWENLFETVEKMEQDFGENGPHVGDWLTSTFRGDQFKKLIF